MRLFLFFFLLPSFVYSASLFDYGVHHGDQVISYNSGWSGSSVQVPIVYLERSESDLFLSPRGIVSFQEVPFDEIVPLDKLNRSAIAVFYAPSSESVTFFRATTTDSNLLRRVTDIIRHEFVDSADFVTLELVIITWTGVKSKDIHGEAAFQLVLATDGVSTYSLILYKHLPWSASEGVFAQAGFTHYDGRYQGTINSGTPDITQLTALSNVDQDGVFLFRISGHSIEDPRDREEYVYNDDYEEEQPKGLRQDCPPNPYSKDGCPVSCQTLIDDVGCSLCLCRNSEEDRRQLESVAAPEEVVGESILEREIEEEIRREEEEKLGNRGGRDGLIGDTTADCSFRTCSSSASCDGYCCRCHAGYYGNGVECLKRDEPQRITGGFYGSMNGQEIDTTELHTFVTTNDGKAYTAVSKIPRRLGFSFLLLSPIGSIMGFLFAETTSSPGAKKGFEMMGGLFNRTSTVHLDDTYSVTIQQTFSGRDIYHYFKANVVVNGNLPELTAEAKVSYPDYEVEYKRERPGFLRASTTFHVTVTDRRVEKRTRMIVEEIIYFDECTREDENFTPSSLFVRVQKTHVTFDATDGVVRYASENSMSLFGANFSLASSSRRQHGETQYQPVVPVPAPTQIKHDPCMEGHHLCTLPNMFCRASDQKYRCECERGFKAEADPASPLGWTCVDLDECLRGDHNCDAFATCTNTIGSFACECQAGFNGDGHRCYNVIESRSEPNADGVFSSDANSGLPPRPPSEESPPSYPLPGAAPPSIPLAALPAGHCTSHTSCHQWGECVMTPGAEVGICKCRGWYVGDGVSTCGPPEAPQPEHPPVTEEDEEGRRRHTSLNAGIPQHNGRPCNGYICDPNAECMPSPDGGSECVCRSGYHGNGISCESLVSAYGTEEQPQFGAVGTVCRSHEECSEHGSCVYSERLGYYRCECTAPYRGDGMLCSAAEPVLGGGVQPGGRPLGCDVTNDCSPDADCVFERTSSGEDHFRCICRSGFYGDGWRCTKVDLTGGGLPLPPVLKRGCDTERNCHTEAQCLYDAHLEKYACECRPGYNGDGFNCVKLASAPEAQPNWEVEARGGRRPCREASDCHVNGHCVSDERSGEYFCECLPGFNGDGVKECTIADECNPADPSSCRQNSECVYGDVERAYTCKCVQGFTGDGVSCLPHAPVSDCSTNPRQCHANAQCVYNHERNEHVCICRPGSVGDGQKQCVVQEQARCGNCSVNAHCASNPMGGWKCTCNVGYQGSGHVCAPFTSCLDDKSICDVHAECVPGEGGHYVCNCHYGYHGNGRICSPDTERGGEELLVARGMILYQRGVQADIPGKQLIVIPHHIAVSIDFDCIEERIIWSDISGHQIRTAALNGSETKTYYANLLESPEGIAVDWSSRNVYYADSAKDEIGVLSLNGKYKKALVTEGLVNPRALAIDTQNKHLYYTDWHRSHPIIGRMSLDGKNVIQFVNTDIHLPNGLTILHQRRELCWVDAGAHSLSCIGFDGQNRRTVFTDLQYPFGLTNINEQKFYWTDWKDNRIHTVSIYGEAYESFPISLGGSGKAYGILNVPKQCHGPTTACSLNNGGCKYLCLPAEDGVHCACPDNKKGDKNDGC